MTARVDSEGNAGTTDDPPALAPEAVAGRPIGRQLLDLRLALLSAALFVLAVAAGAVALARAFDLELYAVTADPAAVAQGPFAVGFLSMLAVMGWAAAFAVALLGASVLYAIDPWSGRGRMLAAAAALSGLLALDDAFMLHEVVVPEYLFAPEVTMYAVSAAVALGFLWLGRPYLRGTEYALLGLAVLAFGASVAADQALPFDGRVTFVEDLAKFSGIVLWCLYLFRTARSMATRAIDERLVQLRRRQHDAERTASSARAVSGPWPG